MIYEYALDPDLFADEKAVLSLCEAFGKGKGRLISDMPSGGWDELARAVIKTNYRKPKARKKITAVLLRFRRRALYKRPDCKWVDRQNWVDNILINHHIHPFHAILSNQSRKNDAPFLRYDLSLIEKKLWVNQPAVNVKRQAEVMIETIKPMLDCASEVILIDRNFDPVKVRFRRVLFELINFVIKRQHMPQIKKISYFVGDKLATDYLATKCRTEIGFSLPPNIKIDFFIRPKSELHDRFVLTDIGIISFGQGLDESNGSGPEKVLISRLPEEIYKEWRRYCHSKKSNFTISK